MTRKLLVLLSIALSACAVADTEIESGDSRDGSFMQAVDGRADNQSVSDDEVRAILEVVNTYSQHRLVRDVKWYWPAATHVIDYRNGEDEIRGTEDDRVFRALEEVDAVPYIGSVAFNRLRTYVHEHGFVERHQANYDDQLPLFIEAKYGVAIEGEFEAGQSIRIPLFTEKGDRVRFWLRKGDDSQWNPRIRLYDGSDRIFSENPWGFSDARFPIDGDDFERGFEIPSNGEFDVEIANTDKNSSGVYRFTLECVGGPCLEKAIGIGTQDMDGDIASLSNDALLARLALEHERTHKAHEYNAVRKFMFEELDNFDGNVACVYSGDTIETDTIPHYNVMSAEHTWPQSEGAITGNARTDLHHIYPATGLANSIRAAYPFCNVEEVIREVGPAKLGYDKNGTRCFEPQDVHKGNVARAMFYFASSFEQSIDDVQEEVLRDWNAQDPIDEEERVRSAEIAEFQGSVNVFVDTPEILNRIDNF